MINAVLGVRNVNESKRTIPRTGIRVKPAPQKETPIEKATQQ
jgi:hypothetical protein